MAEFVNNNLGGNLNNNLRPSKPFGLNVKVPERTIKQINETITENATSGITNIFNYLKVNEKVFDGTVEKQLNDLFVQDFNTKQILKDADVSVGRHFEMDM